MLLIFCITVNRSESGDGYQCKRHCQYAASYGDAQVLEGQTSYSQETGLSSCTVLC